MILNRIDGSTLDLSKYPSLAWHLATPECHVKEIVDQINGGLYAGQPIHGTVLDLGANCGLFSAFAAPACVLVIAVEPSVRHFDALTGLVHEHNLQNVACHRASIWTKDGQVPFAQDPTNATMDRIDYHNRAARSATVPCNRVDSLMAMFDVAFADFVKMDIEGAEEDVLDSEGFALAAPKIGCLWVECHNYKNWNSGKIVGDNVEALVQKHFPNVQRCNQDLVIGRR